MVYQDFNLLTKTIVTNQPADQDAQVKEFQKAHSVKFSQASFAVDSNGTLWFCIVLFYKE